MMILSVDFVTMYMHVVLLVCSLAQSRQHLIIYSALSSRHQGYPRRDEERRTGSQRDSGSRKDVGG